MLEHENEGQGVPTEIVVGQGFKIPVDDWSGVWQKLKEAVEPLPWGVYVAWAVFDAGGEIIAGDADSKSTFIARYGKGPGQLFLLHGESDE